MLIFLRKSFWTSTRNEKKRRKEYRKEKEKKDGAKREAECLQEIFICHKTLKINLRHEAKSIDSLINHLFVSRAWTVRLLIDANLFRGGLFVFISSGQRTGKRLSVRKVLRVIVASFVWKLELEDKLHS